MVRLRNFTLAEGKFVIDDGIGTNDRVVESIRSSGKLDAHTDGKWLVFPDGYASFVGNHAIIHPNPTPITKALREKPFVEVEIDGA